MGDDRRERDGDGPATPLKKRKMGVLTELYKIYTTVHALPTPDSVHVFNRPLDWLSHSHLDE